MPTTQRPYALPPFFHYYFLRPRIGRPSQLHRNAQGIVYDFIVNGNWPTPASVNVLLDWVDTLSDPPTRVHHLLEDLHNSNLSVIATTVDIIPALLGELRTELLTWTPPTSTPVDPVDPVDPVAVHPSPIPEDSTVSPPNDISTLSHPATSDTPSQLASVTRTLSSIASTLQSAIHTLCSRTPTNRSASTTNRSASPVISPHNRRRNLPRTRRNPPIYSHTRPYKRRKHGYN
jgi:hypothetical protein